MKKTTIPFIMLLLLWLLVAGLTPLAVQAQAPAGQEYIVQVDDWLSKIAEKSFGNALEYPTIVEATNAKAQEDDSFAVITNPDLIEVGQKLWLPTTQEAGTITVGNLSFKPVAIEGLGFQTAVPQNWPAVESEDPRFAYAWKAGLFSFVGFTTTPGNDAQTGIARLLGVNKEDLTAGFIGGQLTEQQVGDHLWSIYTRDEGGVISVVGATVFEKVIYQINLFAESSQKDTILNTILENFAITDPTAVQQTITIEAPAAGAPLTNPFELRGATNQYPFRGSLVYRVLDAEGNQVGRAPFEVVGRLGNPSTFAIAATYKVAADGPGTVEVAEISAADGAIIAIDSVGVMLVADPEGFTITIDDPQLYGSVASPVQVRGKTTDKPFQGTLNYRIVGADGQQISSGFLEASGQVGQVNSFDDFVEFTVTGDGPGRVEVYNVRPEDGSIFAISTVNVWLTKTP